MKSVTQIAREIGISPQAIYKRFKSNPEILSELAPHITRKGGMKFDVEGEQALKLIFQGLLTVGKVDNLVKSEKATNNQLLNRLNNEVEFLRSQLAAANERNHELSLNLAVLTQSNQSLIAMLETKADIQLSTNPVNSQKEDENLVGDSADKFEKQVTQPPKGFWQRLFGK
jgi:predicted DNA binding protein